MSTFKWDPEIYAHNSSNQLRSAREIISRLNLQGNETVLDVGCGDGKITAEIAKMLPKGKIIGIDASKEMTDYAMATHVKDNGGNLNFACMNALELKWNHPFDLIFSNAALHWIKDQKTVLKNFFNILKPHGRLMISFGGDHEILNNIFKKIIFEPKWKTYFENFQLPWYYYMPEEYRNWLIETGFKTLRVELVTKDSTFLELGTWIGTQYLKQRLPENLHQNFVEEIEKRYTEICPRDEKGIIHAKMTKLEVEAEKK